MLEQNKFKGVWTALITPFLKDGSVDWDSFEKLVLLQKEAKITGLVISGTTGEAPTLTVQEKLSLVRKAKALCGDHLLVMAGTGGNNTQQSVELSKLAVESGADALLVVTPPYNKPNTSGLKKHFSEIAKATKKPVCLYHVPGRTAQTLTPDVIKELSSIPNVKMVKEASGDMGLFARAKLDNEAMFLSGDDPTYLASLSLGGEGVISVLSNVLPLETRLLFDAYENNNISLAREYHEAMLEFIDGLFCETNPCPTKAILSHLGHCKNIFRLPLDPVSEKNYSNIVKLYEKTQSRLARISK